MEYSIPDQLKLLRADLRNDVTTPLQSSNFYSIKPGKRYRHNHVAFNPASNMLISWDGINR